jgi:hypothetical protein
LQFLPPKRPFRALLRNHKCKIDDAKGRRASGRSEETGEFVEDQGPGAHPAPGTLLIMKLLSRHAGASDNNFMINEVG